MGTKWLFASDGGAAMIGKAMALAVKLKHKKKEFSYYF
jgi:hypothetical protein